MSRTLSELRQYLVGEWLFNNSFEDSSGNGNHGVPTNVEWVPTERGMKPHISGYVHLTEKITFETGKTLAFWITPAYINQLYSFFGDNDYDNYISYGYNSYSTRIDLEFNGVAKIIYHSSTPFELGHNYHIIITCRSSGIFLYINGQLEGSASATTTSMDISYIARGYSGRSAKGIYYDILYYDTDLDAIEAQLIYNSTKHAYGIQPAERSFSHDVGAVLGSPEGAVFTTDMHSNNADGTLIDLSGNSNHGTVVGCGRAGGYFRDGIYTNGVTGNNQGISFDSNALWNKITEIENTIIFYYDGEAQNAILWYQGSSGSNGIGLWIGDANGGDGTYLCLFAGGKYYNLFTANITLPTGMNVITLTHTANDNYRVYVNGVLFNQVSSKYPNESTADTFTILKGGNREANGSTYYVSLSNFSGYNHVLSLFNSLAVLPLYELDCSKIPVQDGLTSVIPYTSATINSGEFDIVTNSFGINQLVCVSSGQIVLQNAHAFDGDEYLTVEVDGETYSGTGAITQGTVTASISQDSTAITVNMAAGDVLDRVGIQFREPVE